MQLYVRNTILPPKKWAENLNRHFFKEVIQIAKKNLKRCSTSLIIREMQIKTTMRYHITLVRMTIIEKSTNSKYGFREPVCTINLTVTCVHGMGSGATCVQACIHSAQALPDRHPALFLSPVSGQGVHLCRQPHGPAHPVQLHVEPAGVAHWLAVCVAPPEGGGGGVAVGAAEAGPAG